MYLHDFEKYFGNRRNYFLLTLFVFFRSSNFKKTAVSGTLDKVVNKYKSVGECVPIHKDIDLFLTSIEVSSVWK